MTRSAIASEPVRLVLSNVRSVKKTTDGWMARCPAHNDTNPSLSIAEAPDGRVLVHCFAGCATDDVLTELGLTLGDLFPGKPGDSRWTPHGEAVADYEYTDESGQVLFVVCRTESKEFPVRTPDPASRSGWRWSLGGARKVLYRLPNVIEAVKRGESIYAVEGEKDVEAIERAGGAATCNPFGAGKWLDEHSEYLRGAEVVVVADKDDEGRRHAQLVRESLEGVHASVTVVEAREGKDAADHLAAGHVLSDFVPIELPPPDLSEPHLQPIERSVGSEVVEANGNELIASSSSAEQLPSLPLLGQPMYLIEGWSHLLAGYPRSGKTELLVRAARDWLDAGKSVVYLSEEPRSIWEQRLKPLGGDWGALRVVFALGTAPSVLMQRAFSGSEDVVIVDTLRNLLQLRDENDNSEVARVCAPWVAGARQAHKTLVVSHHMKKGGGEHGEGISGGHALLGAFDIALELLKDPHQRERRLLRGYARLIEVREMVYERADDGSFRSLGDPSELGLREVRQRVEAVLEEEWQTTKDVREALDEPRPSEEQVRKALVASAREGSIERNPPIDEEARGKTHMWRRNLTSNGSF
jgi:5S rRNA maturation endonuclease (ribonuclease M5)